MNKSKRHRPREPIVAFLDILGFSAYTEEDLSGAVQVLANQQIILQQKLLDESYHPPSSYPDADVRSLAEAHLVDSFKHFLPFTDSTFIVSEQRDKFASQLSNFLIECVQIVSHAYSRADDPRRPEAVKIKEFPSGISHGENWFPPLWRGGLALGPVHSFEVSALSYGKPLKIPNLAGLAIVKAVRVEKSARGPRLFCESGFERHFGTKIRPFFRPVTPLISELLWPSFIYLDGRKPDVQSNHFHELWHPAVALWKSKIGQPVFEHYDEFLKLLIRSFLCWADTVDYKPARNKVRECLRSDIGEELIDAYLD